MLDYSQFISKEKCMLIAPAGFGKTHTITECLKLAESKGKQLILTHTHAGIASIKEKLKKAGIPSSAYCVETISSFAQKYLIAFYTGNDIPHQEDSKRYFPFVISKAIQLLKIKPVRQVIANSYKGLFVDEYQDCTVKHHELIFTLSELFPTRILGDPLQGIFGFNNEPLVDMEDPLQMGKFLKAKEKLEKPQRWLNGNNGLLGDDLKLIRECLIEKAAIDLSKYSSLEVHLTADIYKDKYSTIMNLLTQNKDILVIDPVSTSINSRIDFIQQFKNIPRLLESIDDKSFYNLSRDADLMIKTQVVQQLIKILFKLFNAGGVKNWFNDKGCKNKIKDDDKLLLKPVSDKLALLNNNISYFIVSQVVREVSKLPDIKCYRKELLSSFCKALEEAELNNILVLDAMTNQRNCIRRMGRKIIGRCVGTTLLTKGLEFDTVAIINAHKFNCPKHLYVAFTRASKRLVIFTNSKQLLPYK